MDYINEISYLKNKGKNGKKHCLKKPFSNKNCGPMLSEIGAIISLLPTKSSKILDVGCGCGWTSVFYAKKGHKVLGIDISYDMINNANINKKINNLLNLDFDVKNAEEINYNSEFDCVIFFDSLHHCINVKKVMRNAYKALKKGGICIISEPGLFHSKSKDSINIVKKYGLLEKEILPHISKKLGKQIGFKNIKIFPRAMYLNFSLYSHINNLPNFKILKKFFKYPTMRTIASIIIIIFYKRYDGIVLMKK